MMLYRGAGLDNVYLANGYTSHALSTGEETVSIHNLEGLHEAIAHVLSDQIGEMDGQVFRFLRKYVDMGQRALGEILGVTENQVSNWERGVSAVPGSSAEFLRALVREWISGNASLREAVDRYNHLDRERSKKNALHFAESEGTWGIAA